MSQHGHLLLDNQLCFALYATSLSMTRAYQPLLKPLGITYPQYLVMLVLWEREGLTVSEIGQRLHLDSGTLTPLLKRLEGAGHIVRERSAEDERQVRVRLTAEGKVLRKKANQVPEQLSCAAQCSLSEAKTIAKHLKKLNAALLQSDLIEKKKTKKD